MTQTQHPKPSLWSRVQPVILPLALGLTLAGIQLDRISGSIQLNRFSPWTVGVSVLNVLLWPYLFYAYGRAVGAIQHRQGFREGFDLGTTTGMQHSEEMFLKIAKVVQQHDEAGIQRLINNEPDPDERPVYPPEHPTGI